jgi:hypothetical protein
LRGDLKRPHAPSQWSKGVRAALMCSAVLSAIALAEIGVRRPCGRPA